MSGGIPEIHTPTFPPALPFESGQSHSFGFYVLIKNDVQLVIECEADVVTWRDPQVSVSLFFACTLI